jgi:nitrate reductase NapD
MTTIAGVLLRVNPSRVSEVRAALTCMRGVEVHACSDDGRVVVVIEDVPGAAAADTFQRLHAFEGVLSAFLAYQYCDESPLQEQPA